MKKLLVVLLALILALGTCASVAMAEEPLKIGYFGLAPTQAFFKQVYDSLEAACAERGYELVGFYTDADPAEMRTAYEQFKTQGVDIIIDGNAYSDIMLPFAEQAVADGIPYIGLFVSFPDLPEAYTFGSSNRDMGIASGTFLGNAVKEEWDGQVDTILLVGTFASGVEITERLTASAETIGTIVDTTNTEVLQLNTDAGNASTTYQVVADALTAHPNQKIVIVCQTDDIANAAFSAVSAVNRDQDVIGTGNDCVDAALEYWQTAIKEGNMTVPWRGSIYLDTAAYGGQLLDMSEAILSGTQEEHNVSPAPAVGGLHNWEEFWPDLLERDFTA